MEHKSSYSTIISHLKSKNQYYIQLSFTAVSYGGPDNDYKYFAVGSIKTFTTN